MAKATHDLVIKNGEYKAHRLAWLITRGSWPIDQLDHINGIRDDNRLANLREASNLLNQQNQRLPRSNNKSGYLGVSWCSSRESFEARIRSQGKRLFLGYFSVADEAHAAYLQAKRLLHAGNTL
jgi:HNH endonuclease